MNAFLLEKMGQGSPPHTWRIRDISATTTHSLGITSTHVENTRLQKAKLA